MRQILRWKQERKVKKNQQSLLLFISCIGRTCFDKLHVVFIPDKLDRNIQKTLEII